ncbi:hypothetical protein RKE25_22655 (plasmid) [Dyella sp. BiH032]|uniref:hypothetical protein n=1 Tax=Dyella sp. BiH032 TaxID=3075430 RepID=UPI0028937582|nr:hypothetical protein [Dyella sp. BiH032]WNL48336.1 hypothetical protein RKE25_22655 [Dyella sp. BiH032]
MISIERSTVVLKFDLLPAKSTIEKYWPYHAESIGYGDNVVYLTFSKIESNGQSRWEFRAAGSDSHQIRHACYRSVGTVRGHLRVGNGESGEVIKPEDYIPMHRKLLADAIQGQAALDLIQPLTMDVFYRDEFVRDSERTREWLSHRGAKPECDEFNKSHWAAVIPKLSDDREDLLADVVGLAVLSQYQNFSAIVHAEFAARLDAANPSPTMAQLF